MDSKTVNDETLIHDLLRSLDGTPALVEAFFASGTDPQPGSMASMERDAVRHDQFKLDMLTYAQKRSWLCVRASAESVRGLARLLRPPPLMFMPGPVVRAGIESSGLACWMLSDGVSLEKRIQRAVAIRKQDINEERGISEAGARAAEGDQEAVLNEAVEWAAKQQEEFLRSASRTGLPAERVPNDIGLAELCDAGYEYRLSTLLAHGTPLAFNAVEAMFRGRSSTNDSRGAIFLNYLTTAANCFCQAAWAYGRYILGPSRVKELGNLLEQTYDSLGMSDQARAYFRKG